MPCKPILFIVTLTSFITSLFAQLPDPKLPPGRNFDLSPWTLQTFTTGLSFVEIPPDSLNHGFTNPFFYTDSLDGAMVFYVPSTGSTTGGSDYPRCELRQSKTDGVWKLTDPNLHQMSASCKVLEVPSSRPITVIGQVHGSNSNSTMFQFRWNGYQAGTCSIEVRFQDNSSAGNQQLITVASGLSLGTMISYVVTMKNGLITAKINTPAPGKTVSQTYTTQYYGTTDLYYFKAGNYMQYSSSGTPEYGKVKFYQVSIDSPAIANNAAALLSGQNALKNNESCTKVFSNVGSNTFEKCKYVYDVRGKSIRGLNNSNGVIKKQSSGVYIVSKN